MTSVTKERPILFSAPMVRALLDGRKTQTRRVVKYRHNGPRGDGKLHPPPDYVTRWDANNGIGPEWHGEGPAPNGGMRGSGWTTCPYGKPGDRLWVREAWRVHRDYDGLRSAGIYAAMGGDVAYCIRYENDGRSEEGWEGRRRVGRFMPRWASRISLEITEVRVERLQEISEEDAFAEGCAAWKGVPGDGEMSAVQAYRKLWESINGAGSWDANPWVWALTFRRMEDGKAAVA